MVGHTDTKKTTTHFSHYKLIDRLDTIKPKFYMQSQVQNENKEISGFQKEERNKTRAEILQVHRCF